MTEVFCPSGKRVYDKRGAITVLNERRVGSKGKRADGLKAYHCNKCNMWHLSHRKDRYGVGGKRIIGIGKNYRFFKKA